jgi:hypothetical protein
MVGIAADGLIFSTADYIAEHPSLTRAQADKLISVLKRADKKLKSILPVVINNERARNQAYSTSGTYHFYCDNFSAKEGFFTEILLKNYDSYLLRFIKNTDRTYMNDNFNTFIARAAAPLYNKESKAEKLPRYMTSYFNKDIISDLSDILRSACMERSRHRQTIILIMLNQYKAVNGKYPSALSELSNIAGFEIPEPVFSGQKDSYNLEGNKFKLTDPNYDAYLEEGLSKIDEKDKN